MSVHSSTSHDSTGRTSSPRLAQSRLLTYRLRPSSITSLPNSFSNFLGFNFVGSSFSNGHPPFGSFDSAAVGAGVGAGAAVAPVAGVTVLAEPKSKAARAGRVGETVADPPASAFLPLKCSITPSRRRSRESSSASGGRFDLRGARPGGGKTHSIPALTQFEQGERLLQRTLRRRQVTQLRELELAVSAGAGRGAGVADTPGSAVFGELSLAIGEWFTPSGEVELNDMARMSSLSLARGARLLLFEIARIDSSGQTHM